MSTPEMVDSINAFILTGRRFTTEDISGQLGISMGTAHKIVHGDLAFSQVSCHWKSSGQCKASYCSKNNGLFVCLDFMA